MYSIPENRKVNYRSKNGIKVYSVKGKKWENFKEQPFQLKVENKGFYDKVDIENPVYNNRFDIYYEAKTIIDGNCFGVVFLDNEENITFQEAYELALFNNMNDANLFLWNGHVFILDKKFLSPKNRVIFRSIENSTLSKKYSNGAKHKVARGKEKAIAFQSAILGIQRG